MYHVLLFGTGSGCKDLLSVLDYEKVDVAAYVDNNAALHGSIFNGKPVISPEDIWKYNFDFIIITTKYYDEIAEQLMSLGISNDKIIGQNLHYSREFNKSLNNHNNILNNFTREPIEPYSACCIQNLGRKRMVDVYYTGDYVRLSSLELIAREIYDSGVEGSIAELGVYKGEFAQIINQLFHNRKFFLFDTFEGFNERDISLEKDRDFSESSVVDFSNTSVDVVLSKMKHPENCVVRKGYFPDTASGIDEEFAFVSIDTDLFKPIYNGLEFFYPRLAKGGYIFVHDYNNYRYKGAGAAVKEYCRHNGINYFPLSDMSGTAVIAK